MGFFTDTALKNTGVSPNGHRVALHNLYLVDAMISIGYRKSRVWKLKFGIYDLHRQLLEMCLIGKRPIFVRGRQFQLFHSPVYHVSNLADAQVWLPQLRAFSATLCWKSLSSSRIYASERYNNAFTRLVKHACI